MMIMISPLFRLHLHQRPALNCKLDYSCFIYILARLRILLMMIMTMTPLLHSTPPTSCPEYASDVFWKSDFIINPDYWQHLLLFLPLINHDYRTQVPCKRSFVKWPFRKCRPSPLIFQSWTVLDTLDIFGHFGHFWTVLNTLKLLKLLDILDSFGQI